MTASDAGRSRTLDAARLVAEHWRKAMLSPAFPAGMAHPLCMVLAALDGETDPDEVGVGSSPERDALLAMTAHQAGCAQHDQPMQRCLDYGKTHVIPNADDACSRTTDAP